MLNGDPLNSVELNSSGGPGSDGPDPEYVVAGISYLWRDRVVVDGVDVSDQLVGGLDYDREEGAASVAGFGIYLPPGPVVPSDWVGLPVTIDFITTTVGVTTEERRFTGVIALPPDWNSELRVLNCECSDQLQQRVEAMPQAEIDTLTGGLWSEDLFEPLTGRSHWDYALERMSTRTASLDCDPLGAPRVTSWYAKAVPDFVFGPGTTIDQSVKVEPAGLVGRTNRIELEVSFRYSRLWQRNQNYSWVHPGTDGTEGISGFCSWRGYPTELPTIGMVEEATSSEGMTLLSPQYYLLPPTMPNPCGDGAPWQNRYLDLLLGADWTGARRWVQTVTETYHMVLATPTGEGTTSRVVQRIGFSVEVEDPVAEAWTENPITGGTSGYDDRDDEARRVPLVTGSQHIARAEIVGAHRETTVTWQVPTSMALGIDLTHTLELNDQGVRARGKCRRISGSHDPDTGLAITTLSIALMRGGGESDALTVPPRLGVGVGGGDGGGAGIGSELPTQISGFGLPDYDPELYGFAGNSDAGGGPSQFPRHLDIPTDEIPADDRDERVLTGDYLYRIGIPNDLLEL